MSEDKGKSLVYFVRHAESVANQRHITLLPEEDGLTELGRLQAQLLGKHLEKVSFTHIFSSPFIRALQTAEEILSHSKATSDKVQVEVDANIYERNSGIFEQKSDAELVSAIIAAGGDPLDWTPEGAESKEDVERRLEHFLQKIGSLVDLGDDRKIILVVTHCALMVHLWHYLLRRSDKYTINNWKPEYFKLSRNTGYFLFAIGESADPGQSREMEVLVAHENCHLKSISRGDAFGILISEEPSTVQLKECVQQ